MTGLSAEGQLPVVATAASANIDYLEHALSKHLTGLSVDDGVLTPLSDISELAPEDRPTYRFQTVPAHIGHAPTYLPYSPLLVSPTLLPGNLVNIPFLRRKTNFANGKRPDRYVLDLLQRRLPGRQPISYTYTATDISEGKGTTRRIEDVTQSEFNEDFAKDIQGVLPSYLAEALYPCRQCATSHHSCVYDNTGPPTRLTEELVPSSWSTVNPIAVQSIGCIACNDSGKPCQFTVHLGHVKVINAIIAFRLRDPAEVPLASQAEFKADPLKYIAITAGEVKDGDKQHTRQSDRHKESSPSNGLGEHGIHFPTTGGVAGKRKGQGPEATRLYDVPLKRARVDGPLLIDPANDVPFTYEYTGVDYATPRTIGMGASRVRLERRLHSELYNNSSSQVGKLVSALLEAVRQPAEDDLVAQMHPQLLEIEQEIRYLRAQNDRLRYQLADATRTSGFQPLPLTCSPPTQHSSFPSTTAGFDLMIAVDKNNPGPSRLHDLPNLTDAIHISHAVLFHDVSAETTEPDVEGSVNRIRLCGLGEHVSINSLLQSSATQALAQTASSSRQFDLSSAQRRRHSQCQDLPMLPTYTPIQALQKRAGPHDDLSDANQSLLRGWNDLPHHQRGLEMIGRGSSSNPSDPTFWLGWSDFAPLAHSWGKTNGLPAPHLPTRRSTAPADGPDWGSLSRRIALAGGSQNPQISKEDEMQLVTLATITSRQAMRPELLQYTESQVHSLCRELQNSWEAATVRSHAISLIPGLISAITSGRPGADEITALHLRTDARSPVWLQDLHNKLAGRNKDGCDRSAIQLVLGYMTIGRYFFPIEFERKKDHTHQICVYSNTGQAMGRSYVRQVFKAFLVEQSAETSKDQHQTAWVYEARPSRFEVEDSNFSGPLLIHLFVMCLSAKHTADEILGVTEITRSAWVEDENDIDVIAQLVYSQMEWMVQLAEWSVNVVKQIRTSAAVKGVI